MIELSNKEKNIIIYNSGFMPENIQAWCKAKFEKLGEEEAHKHLEYHKSWNWLVPVATTILNHPDYSEDSKKHILFGLTLGDATYTFNQVVEFILNVKPIT